MTARTKDLTVSNKPDLTVAAGLARGLLRFAAAKGANEAEMLARAQIDPAALTDQNNRVPFASYVRLMRAGQELANDPALALHYGSIDDLSEISVLGLIGQASETFYEALLQFNRYNGLVIETDTGGKKRFEVARENGVLELRDNRLGANDFPELTESTFARMTCGSRRFTKQDLVTKIHVTHKAPSYRDEYEAVLKVPVVFESNRNALVLAEAWITQKLAAQPRYVFGILSEHADKLISALRSSKTTRGRVESLILPILHKGDISMEKIAEQMAMSRQTLFRKLKDEGVTFEKLLDELRHQMALNYLDGKKVSVNETAYLVGFSEAAAFSRAFKRWTGKSPRNRA